MSDRFDTHNSAMSNQGAKRSAKSSDPSRPKATHSPSQYNQEPIRVPPPPKASLVRERSLRRNARGGRRGSEWAWVVIAGGMIAVFGLVILGMLVLVRLPHVSQEVIPTADLSTRLPTPVDAPHRIH